MDNTVTISRDAAWDEIALDVIGDEFSLDELIRSQVVKSFASPVYSYVVPEGAEILAPQPVEVDEDTFKAPWE